MLWKLLVAIASFLTGHIPGTEEPLDVVLGPQTDHETHLAFQSLYGGHEEMIPNPSGAGIRNNQTRWTGFPGRGVVPYTIDQSVANLEPLLKQAIEQYHKYTCIRFVKRTNQRDYVRIIKDRGCYSYVGKIGGAQPLSLGVGCGYVGTIVHELGHAIGLFHEHQRSDRDRYLNVYANNVISGQGHNFQKTAASNELIFTKYDYSSIMHYGNYAFSKRPGQLKTMEAKNGTPLKEPYDKAGMNSNDIEMIKKLYQCR